MAIINRMRVGWGGSAVAGGGLTTFYVNAPTSGWKTAVHDFFDGLKSLVPVGVTWTIPHTGDQLDSSSGDLVGTWTDGGPTTVTGTASAGDYAAGVGGRITWNTLGRTNNRRVRGTTYIVPLASSNYSNDGTLSSTARGALQFNADTLFTALGPKLVIWTRPNAAHAGAINSVVSTTGVDMVSWLRTRRY